MPYEPMPYQRDLTQYNQAAPASEFQVPMDAWRKYLKDLLDGKLGAPEAPGAMTPYGSFGANPLDHQNPQRIMYQRQPDYAYGPLYQADPEQYRQQALAQSAYVPMEYGRGPQPVGPYNLFTPQGQVTSQGGDNNQTLGAAAAARRVAMSATADQLKSEEFRRTLQALMMEGGLTPIDPNNWRP